MALEYTNDGPRALAILSYSQSDNPDSEHFADQTELFSKKQWRPVLLTGKAIAADTKRDYEVSTSQVIDNKRSATGLGCATGAHAVIRRVRCVHRRRPLLT